MPLLYPVYKDEGSMDKPNTEKKSATKSEPESNESSTADNKENKEESSNTSHNDDEVDKEVNNKQSDEPDTEKPPAAVDVNKPIREFEGGSLVEVSMMRENTARAWGFGIATEWLGVGHGHANVVSNIHSSTPADGALQLHDIIVQIDGHLVESSSLAEVKESMLDTETVVKLNVYRMRSPRAFDKPPDLEPIIIPKPTKKETAKAWWQKNVVAKVKKDSPQDKPPEPTPKKKDLNCTSVWSPAYQKQEKIARERQLNKASWVNGVTVLDRNPTKGNEITMNATFTDTTLV